MNARKAKEIRRRVYGKGHHPGPVQYRVKVKTGAVVADDYRKIYQDTKMVNR
jgi:capsid portal protein